MHLLVPAEETEPIVDEFEQRCSGAEGCHVLLMPVEAVLGASQGGGGWHAEDGRFATG